MQIYTQDLDNVKQHLTRLGLKRILTRDPDLVRLSNLGRDVRRHLSGIFERHLANFVHERQLVINNEDSDQGDDAEVLELNETASEDD